MFRIRISAVTVAFLLLGAGCKIETNTRPETLDRAFAARAVTEFQQHGYVSLAGYMRYPEAETPQERAADQVGVTELLQLAERRFGPAVVHGPVRGVPTSVQLSVGAGTVEYWAKHPGARRYTWAVSYGKVGAGWLYVDVANHGKSPAIKAVSFAVPANRENAAFVGRGLAEGIAIVRKPSPN